MQRFGNEVNRMNNKELQRIYDLLVKEQNKVKAKIDRIDMIIDTVDLLNREYWTNVRIEKVAYLNGLSKAADIVFKELNR